METNAYTDKNIVHPPSKIKECDDWITVDAQPDAGEAVSFQCFL